MDVQHIHTLLTSTPSNRALESLHPALLAIINNVAPYIRNLQRATSVMIFNVFVSLSQPGFLLVAEGNWRVLESCLDGINGILEGHLEGECLTLRCIGIELESVVRNGHCAVGEIGSRGQPRVVMHSFVVSSESNKA